MPPSSPDGGDAERGSAVVEFTFLCLLLMVPVVYFIITVGLLQGGSFAVVGAADQAAKVYVAQPDAASGRAAAGQVRSTANAYLNRTGAFGGFSGLAVAPATGSPEGSTAVVFLSAAVHPP